MGKKDTVTKEYISRSPIFADVFNQFIYHGEQIIQPEQLREMYSECDDKILALAPDYHINLIAPYHQNHNWL